MQYYTSFLKKQVENCEKIMNIQLSAYQAVKTRQPLLSLVSSYELRSGSIYF